MGDCSSRDLCRNQARAGADASTCTRSVVRHRVARTVAGARDASVTSPYLKRPMLKKLLHLTIPALALAVSPLSLAAVHADAVDH